MMEAEAFFMRRLKEAEERGYQRALADVMEIINKSEYAFDTVGGSKRLTALVQRLRAEKKKEEGE